MDQERLDVAEGFGFAGLSLFEFDRRSYAQAKHVVQPQGPIPPGACSIPKRYITEDVPMGLVPLSQMARLASIPTPTIDLMIELACRVQEENYWEKGRTLQKMGLEGLSIPQILQRVEKGTNN